MKQYGDQNTVTIAILVINSKLGKNIKRAIYIFVVFKKEYGE